MNTKGNGYGTIIVVVLIAMFALGGYVAWNAGLLGGKTESIVSNPSQINNGAGCSIAPSYVNTGVDALVANQNVTPATFNYIVNGVYVGTSHTPSPGQNVQILGDATDYLADVESVNPVACGPNPVNFKFFKYANATVTIYTDAGTTVLTNAAAGGPVNETAITAAGGTKNWKVHLVGAVQKSTGTIFTVVELPSNSAANVTSSGLNLVCDGGNLPKVAIPGAVSATNTNSLRYAFEIPAIKDGAVKDCFIQVTTNGAKALRGSTYVSFYGKQMAVETDGTIKELVYDANSNAKYQDTYTYNFALV